MNQRDKHSEPDSGPLLSIIVPVFNEAGLIADFLRHVRIIAPQAEVIVVDGGSNDGTREIAASLADRVITARRGRASQMNAAAASAQGAVLWFLHVDSRLPANAVADIARVLQNPRVSGGCFRIRMPCRQWIYRVTDTIGNLGVDLFLLALGDHGIFCRSAAFRAVGGYPEIPILEDAELYRKLRRFGRMRQLPALIVCSPRTYERLGPYRTTAAYFLILALYVMAVPIPSLYKIYLRLRGGFTAM